jgi:membrane protease YdiL (CAAX protease family)
MTNFNEAPQSNPAPPAPEKALYPPPQEAFLVMVGTLVISLLGGALLAQIDRIGVILTEALFIVPPIFYLKRKGYSIRRCLRWNRIKPSVLISTILVGIALIVLLDEADRLVSLIFPMPEELQKLLNNLFELKTWSDYLIIGAGAVVIAAFCEESLFRGFLQVSLEANTTVNRGVLFSALIFALAHFNPWWLMQILLLGVFLGFVSWRSNSSIPGMVVHGLNNGLSLLAGGSTTGAAWAWYNKGEHVSPAILVAAGALLFVGLKFFLRVTQEPLIEESLPDESSAA